MPDIKSIREHLTDTAKYHGLSYAAIVGVAAEIENVEDKQERAALRREFRELHALTSQVWARVAKRFDTGEWVASQSIRAMAYCCQLPEDECMEMWHAHFEHINEPGALGLILRDVNDALDARRSGHAAKRATSLAEQVADLILEWRGNGGGDGHYVSGAEVLDNLEDIPSVAAELKRREGKAK